MRTTLAPTPLAPAAGPVAGLPGFTHAYANMNNTRLHYVSGGQGPTVVLLHGWPYTWALWHRLLPLLAEAGYSVIAPDLPGLGASDQPAAGYSKRNVAREVHGLVQQLGHETCHLMGADIGAMVAYAYAAEYPAEVRRLVLSESLLPGFGLEELMNPATGGYWHFGFHMQVDLAAFLTAGKEAAYLLPTLGMMSTDPAAATLAEQLFLPSYLAPGGMRAGFAHYGPLLADGQENRARFTAPLPMPVLILNGERGLPQEPLLAGARRVATTVSADLVPASGHTLALDNPAWLAQRLAQFFAM
jgi:pimeloyl-ACP methyl ester carboxylesterase